VVRNSPLHPQLRQAMIRAHPSVLAPVSTTLLVITFRPMHGELFQVLREMLSTSNGQPGSGPDTDAAVLVPLFLSECGCEILYTERSNYVEHHRGEVSFPGGRFHPGVDRTLRDCALRETHEEIGLVPTAIDVLGAMEPVRTLSSSFVITPFIGVIPYPYQVELNQLEVSQVFSVPLKALQDPKKWKRESREFRGNLVSIDAFRWKGHLIWGATQRITADLINLVSQVES